MPKRFKWSIISFTALLVGALDYMLYRQDTYIGALSVFPAMPFHWGYGFFAYYFPDFLWAFSFIFGSFAILSPFKRNTVLCLLITVAYGCAWELAQHLDWISGTADWIDIGMYIAAAISAVIIKHYILRRDQHEKDTGNSFDNRPAA